MNNTCSNRYINGLDGLRALAIFFIVAYHFSFSWAGGGFLGVDIFFVLSGYLVTSKLLKSQEDNQGFDLKRFWSGRVQRLLPAAYTMISTTGLWVILYKRDMLAKIWGDFIASTFYGINWWFIFHKLSYFDSFGSPSPLKHLWFIAVQEQFFFLWPVVLMLGLKCFKKRERFSIVIFILALCSALLMGILYNPDGDPSRVYYGTDTRAFELLAGSLLATLLPMEKLLNKKVSSWQRNALNIAGIITLGAFIFSAVYVNEFDPFLYRGGMLLSTLNTVLLIVSVSYPGSFLGSILSWKPMRWIGTRSFGIYLWHYPIMVLSTPVYEIGNPVYWRVFIQLAVSCIAAELSYRFIETPVRKLGVKGFLREHLSFNIFKWGQLTPANKISALILLSIVAALAAGITGVARGQQVSVNTEVHPTEVKISNNVQDIYDKTAKDNSAGKVETEPVKDTAAGTDKKNETNSAAEKNNYKKILAIGDSIMVDIAPYLGKEYDNITIDGKVARNMSAAAKLAPAYASFNSPENAVILEIGTNGGITDAQINFFLKTFAKAHVYLVNTRVPRSWEKADNKILKEKADERENVMLVDWYSEAIEHPEYFGKDGVHLTASGSKALVGLIKEALNIKE